MRFRGLDLNLLSAFDVLMRERSVSAAARKLNLSQPATSAALSRLRVFFADDILVVQGKRMFPTAFAERLAPQVRQVLAEVDSMLANRSQFEPATAQRTFRLIASDYVIAAVIVPLVEQLSVKAPGIMLELNAPSERGHLEIAEGRADLLISPDYYVAGEHPSELLFEEAHVVVGWESNPLMQARLSAETFLDARHVGVRIGAQREPSFGDRQMSLMGHTRRIELETHSFLTIPLLLEGTTRLALLQERLAKRLCRSYALAVRPLPFDFPAMREMMQYHRTRQNDAGLAWLRGVLRSCAEPNI
jgi:DNA-binding transcriptional LysR family regulator